VELPHGFHNESNDNRILKVCKGLMEKGENVTLVTKDIIVRLKSQMLGVTAEDFTTEQSPKYEEQYTGRMNVYTSDKLMSEFKKKGIATYDIYIMDENNQFFIIHSETDENKTLLGRFNGDKIVPLKSFKDEPFGVKPKNVGQRFLQEALMQDASAAPLVIVKGTEGTAKTFYSLAAGLEQTLDNENRKYRSFPSSDNRQS